MNVAPSSEPFSSADQKTGWPWSEDSADPQAVRPDPGWPRITVVTPSFNQGTFVEQTIRSVLMQGYPNLEYIVIDGGSTDQSVEIIKKYENYLGYWESAQDRGQVHAIHKGFERATGDILCWLNSDDWYLPGSLFAVAAQFQQRKIDFLHGGCLLRFEKTPAYYFAQMPQMLRAICNDLAAFDFIDQPSSFWSRRVWEQVGPLDESLNYAFDWDFFIRLSQKFPLQCSEGVYSVYRHHDAHKTGTGGDARVKEVVEVVKRYSTEDWARAYEECQNHLLPASREFLKKSQWLAGRRGGWRLLLRRKNAILKPILRRHGEHKIKVASIMTGIYWDPLSA